MSSSRDLSSLIGVPGISLAISTASRHVVAARAPAEAAAEQQPVDLALVGRQAGRCDRRGKAASPFCVLVQTSHLSGV